MEEGHSRVIYFFQRATEPTARTKGRVELDLVQERKLKFFLSLSCNIIKNYSK